jgi:hypothetical protein
MDLSTSSGIPGIIVLGMHRSGTSLTAELVQKWGAYGNQAEMLPGDRWNPRGYWEPAPLVRLNDELLAMVQSRWNVPPTDEAQSRLASLAQHALFRSRALDLLDRIRASGRPWFWKDPRLALLLPFWKQLWGDVVFVVPVRDPGDIAQSLGRRDGFSFHYSLALWQRYTLEIIADREVRSSGIFVNYDELLADPETGCRRLCDRLDRQFGVAAPASDQRVEMMAAAVEPLLRRSRGDLQFSQNPLASEAQKALHNAVLQHSKGHPQALCGDFSISPQWREDLTTQDLVHRLGLGHANCKVYWRAPHDEYREDQSSSAIVTMDGTPQKVRLTIAPPPNTALAAARVFLTDRPAVVWLVALEVRDQRERAVWTWDGHADSIAALPRNEIGTCGELSGETGCMLRLDGHAPWIDLEFDGAQSSSLVNGGVLELLCSYNATAEHATWLQANATYRNADQLRSLEARQTQVYQETLARLQGLEARQAQLHQEALGQLQGVEARQTALHQEALGQLQGVEARQTALHREALEQLQGVEASQAHLHQEALRQLQGVEARQAQLHREALEQLQGVEASQAHLHQEALRQLQGVEARQAELHRETLEQLQRLEARQTELHQETLAQLQRLQIKQGQAHEGVLSQLQRLTGSYTESCGKQADFERESIQRLQMLEMDEAEMRLLVESILHSRTWKTMIGLGRIVLFGTNAAASASQNLARHIRRLWKRHERDDGPPRVPESRST